MINFILSWTLLVVKDVEKEYTELAGNQFLIISCFKDILINLSAASNMFIFYDKRTDMKMKSWTGWEFNYSNFLVEQIIILFQQITIISPKLKSFSLLLGFQWKHTLMGQTLKLKAWENPYVINTHLILNFPECSLGHFFLIN